MLSRARYCWPGSNYPVTLHDCSPGPPPGAGSAAEASLPVPRSPRASFLSGMRPVARGTLSALQDDTPDVTLVENNSPGAEEGGGDRAREMAQAARVVLD